MFAHRFAAILLLLALLVLSALGGGCALEARFYSASNKDFPTPDGIEDVYVKSRGGTVHSWFLSAPAARVAPPNSAAPHAGEPVVKRPALLFCHGARFQIEDLLPYVRPMAERAGVSLMMVSYRGFGRSSPLADINRKSTVADALAAYDALAARPDVDPDRIVVMGYSLGGPVALAVATQRPVAAVVVGGTFSHAKDALADRDLSALSWLIGDIYDPADSAAKLATKPLLLFHGDADASAPVYHVYAIAAAAARAGVPTTLRIIPGAGHRDVFAREELPAMVSAFVKEHITSDAPAPSDPARSASDGVAPAQLNANPH